MTIDVSITPGSDFRAVAARLRGADKSIRKELNQAIKAATAPAEADLKRAILAIESKGVGGGGGKARGRHNTTASGRLPKHTGLRKAVAAGVTRKITYAGFRTGVRIRVDPKRLPPDQRTLLKRMNDGKTFRHPVMGNTDAWVGQSFTPAHWFDDTMKRHESEIKRQIGEAARRAIEQLQ